MHRSERRQRDAQHFLCRGLADAAGHRDHAPGETRPGEGAQPRQARERVVHHQPILDGGDVPVQHDAGGTRLDRPRGMVMAVARLADQRDEQIAWLDGAGIDRHTRCVERRAKAPTRRLQQFGGGPEWAAMADQECTPIRPRTTLTSSNGCTTPATVCPCS